MGRMGACVIKMLLLWFVTATGFTRISITET